MVVLGRGLDVRREKDVDLDGRTQNGDGPGTDSLDGQRTGWGMDGHIMVGGELGAVGGRDGGLPTSEGLWMEAPKGKGDRPGTGKGSFPGPTPPCLPSSLSPTWFPLPCGLGAHPGEEGGPLLPLLPTPLLTLLLETDTHLCDEDPRGHSRESLGTGGWRRLSWACVRALGGWRGWGPSPHLWAPPATCI